MVNYTPRILYEDNHLLVVDKPAGMLTQGDASRRTPLLEHCRNYLKRRDGKPGNVFLGMVQRLDRPVSGALVMAKTSKAAQRVSRQIRERRLLKCYLAVTEKSPQSVAAAARSAGTWVEVSHRLRRVGDRSIASDRREGGQPATLLLRTLLIGERSCFHAVRLITGRKHQIRAQLAARGMVIGGDRKYGAKRTVEGERILLHSFLLRLIHPTRATPVEAACPPPEALLSQFDSSEQRTIRRLLANPRELFRCGGSGEGCASR